MNTSKVLFENENYVVSRLFCGIVIQNKHTGKGMALLPDHPQFAEYLEAFISDEDKDVFPEYCKALLD